MPHTGLAAGLRVHGRAFAHIAAFHPEITALRRDLHAHPELGFEERYTADRVQQALRLCGVDEVHTGIGKTGVVAVIRGRAGKAGGSGRMIGLRADMDALPMTEHNDFAWKSTHTGRMHGCGHDGHTAMLVGAARYLAETRNFDGTAVLIFQPGEEGYAGAKAMIEDGLFERFPMDAVFGMHNMPSLERGKIYFTSGPLFAAVDNWEVVLTGKGSHGSMPERSIDPVVAGASLVMALQTIVSRNVAAKDSAVVSVGAFLAGDAGNVIPQTATLRLSTRTSNPETRKHVLGRIKAIVAAQSASYDVSYEIREGSPGAVLANDPAQTEQCANVARALLGDEQVIMPGPTFMGSEDFAYYAQKVPGTYCLIGNGDTAMVHHPMYEFDDRNLPIGAAYWVALTEHYLK